MIDYEKLEKLIGGIRFIKKTYPKITCSLEIEAEVNRMKFTLKLHPEILLISWNMEDIINKLDNVLSNKEIPGYYCAS